ILKRSVRNWSRSLSVCSAKFLAAVKSKLTRPGHKIDRGRQCPHVPWAASWRRSWCFNLQLPLGLRKRAVYAARSAGRSETGRVVTASREQQLPRCCALPGQERAAMPTGVNPNWKFVAGGRRLSSQLTAFPITPGTRYATCARGVQKGRTKDRKSLHRSDD